MIIIAKLTQIKTLKTRNKKRKGSIKAAMCKTSLKTEHGGSPFFLSIPSSDVDDELGGKKRPGQCQVKRNTTLFHQQLHKNRQQKARFLIFIAWVRI